MPREAEDVRVDFDGALVPASLIVGSQFDVAARVSGTTPQVLTMVMA